MGLLTRISNVFTGRPGEPFAANRVDRFRRHGTPAPHAAGSPEPADAEAIAESKAAGVATLDEPLDTADASEGALRAVSRRVEVAPPAPRTRQELFEDLQKNYREAVELIRKVDGHLDRDESRAEHFMAIARRIDDAVPTVERVPDHVSKIGEQIVEAIRGAAAGEDKRAARIEQALSRAVSNLDRSSGAQVELAATMSAFRETLAEIDRSNRRSAQALESMDERRAEREDEVKRMLASGRTWMLLALFLSVAMGTVAMAIAVVAVVTSP